MSLYRSASAWQLGRLLAYGGGLARMTARLSPCLRCTRPCSNTAVPADEAEPQDSSSSSADRDDSSSSSSSPPEDNRSAILRASLPHVPECGWTPDALEEGARSLGLPPSVASSEVFPRGGAEIIDYFERESNESLVEFLTAEEESQGSKLIRPALEYRLRMLIPYMEKWPQAMAIKAFPYNVPSALENLALMVDDVWYYSGDRSTDFNWYTKRGLLALVYSSTEVFMVQDGSVDYQDTWDFLDRRMQDTANFSKGRKQLEDSLNDATKLFSAGVTTIRNMMGFNSRDRS